MGIITRTLNKLNPLSIPVLPEGRMRGVKSSELIFGDRLSDMVLSQKVYERFDMLTAIEEMSSDGALADKALDRLCQDASENEVRVDAKPRRKKIIENLLKTINYQQLRKDLLYNYMRYGDLFIQLEYIKSSRPGVMAFISRILEMPVKTMIRNSDRLDDFPSSRVDIAFAQVQDIRSGLLGGVQPVFFPFAKMVHARNDLGKSYFFRYGLSSWASGIKTFNLAMMLLEDSAIMRHENAGNWRVHRVGAGLDPPGAKTGAVEEYQENIESQVTSRTTDVYISGDNQIEPVGGTKNVMSSVDDIMLALSILSIAVDYPLDLLSGMISKSSSGEELFRKENVVRRSIGTIIKKEAANILRPLIDRELTLAGNLGDYKLVTTPASFEDDTKRSKRGLGELAALVKSATSFHAENNKEISWDEEKERIRLDAQFYQELSEEFPDGVEIMAASGGGGTGGNQGDERDTADQQARKTPGSDGTEGTEENTGS